MTLFWFRTHSPNIAWVALASFSWTTLLSVVAAAAPSVEERSNAARQRIVAGNAAPLDESVSGAARVSTQSSVWAED
jgi:hypothetical protein